LTLGRSLETFKGVYLLRLFQTISTAYLTKSGKLKIIASFTINYVRLSLMIFFSNSGYVTSIIMHLNVAYLKT